MFEIRYVAKEDKIFWYTLDKHLSESEFELKIRDKRGYVICDNDKPIGLMRYNLFWDIVPFLNLIELEDSYQGKGYGKLAMLYWENEMQNQGHKQVMTSTQSDEQAQLFYRKIGYKDFGCLLLENEPLEILLIKYFIKTVPE